MSWNATEMVEGALVDSGTTDYRVQRVAWIAALAISAALIAAPWRGHVDDMDAQLYLVIARTMARERLWFDLQCLPGFYPHFREHLPFGFWPAIAAIRLFGEWAVGPVYGLFTLGAIVMSGRIARRIGGPWAGVAAMILLGTCESIWQYGGRLLCHGCRRGRACRSVGCSRTPGRSGDLDQGPVWPLAARLRRSGPIAGEAGAGRNRRSGDSFFVVPSRRPRRRLANRIPARPIARICRRRPLGRDRPLVVPVFSDCPSILAWLSFCRARSMAGNPGATLQATSAGVRFDGRAALHSRAQMG